MSYHSFTNVLEYIPKKYVGLSSQQLQDRSAVYAFKDGNCPAFAKERLVEKIKNVIGSNPSAWVVCFIPASTKSKHMRRYGELSSYLRNRLSCPVYVDGIDVAYDRESGHMTGKTGNPTENMEFNASKFRGKKVVLVDDVRTRGITFNLTADKMVSLGAATVFGVFLAQTIHPNLPIDNSPRFRGGYYDEVLNDFMADEMAEEMYQQEMADEMANEIMEEELYQQQMEEEFMYEIGEYC